MVSPLESQSGHFTLRFKHDSGDYNAHFGVESVAATGTPLTNGSVFLGNYDGVYNPATYQQVVEYSISSDQIGAVYKTHWEGNHRLSSVQPHVNGGIVQFDCVLDPASHGQSVLWNASAAEINDHYAEMWNQKMRLLTLRPFLLNGEVRFCAVWNPEDKGQLMTYNRDLQGINVESTQQAPKGLYLSEVTRVRTTAMFCTSESLIRCRSFEILPGLCAR